MGANVAGGRYTTLRRALWAGFALAVAAIVGAAAWMIDLDRRLVAARVEREAQNLRMTLSADLRQAMARIDGYLLNSIVRLPLDASAPGALPRYLREAMAFRPVPEVRALLLLDGSGRVSQVSDNSGAPAGAALLAAPDADQLSEMRSGIFFSPPVAEAGSETPLVLVSRPVRREGRTSFLAAALDIRFFQNLLPVIDIGPGGALGIVMVHGTRLSILARRPELLQQPIGTTRDMTAGEIAAAQSGAGRFTPATQPDGVAREFFYGSLEGSPMFVIVGIPKSEVSAEVWRAVAPKAGLALLVLLGGSALFWVLLRELRFAEGKEAEEAQARLEAQRSEERFSRMFQFSPNAAMVTSFVGGRIINVNEAMLRILGRTRKDVVGLTTMDVGFWRSPDERAQALENLRLGKGSVQRFENTIRTPSGEEKLTIVTTTRVELEGEEVLLSMIEDVTEKRRAEQLLGESERRLAKIIEASPESITINDLDNGTFIEINPACERLYGYARDELIGRSSLELGFWPDPSERARFVAELKKNEVVNARELRLRRKDGALVDVLATAALIDFEGRQLMLFQALDITERKRAERRLGESEARLAKMIEASPEAITIGRLEDGVFVEANPACEQLTGYAREELVGRSARELGFWPDPEERKRFVADVQREGIVNGRELRLRRKDGDIRYLLASAAVIEFEGRKLMMFQAVDITDRKRAEARAQYLATQDPLTGLPNRVLLMDRLAHAITAAQRLGTRIVVYFIDLDRFKAVNDSLGHHLGDQLLKEVAARITRATRKDDTLARLGGDEFVLVAEGIASKSAAEPVARKMLEALGSPFVVDHHTISISASIGIVAYPDDADEAADLLRAADIAMYRAKDLGRNRFQFFSAEMNVRVIERQKLENRLRQALERGTLEIHYQPKVEIRSGRVMGAEALLRWRDAELGDVSPVRFVAVAEETGLIVSLGRWVIGRVTRQIRDWSGRGVNVPIAVNLSVRQFGDGLVEEVAASLKAANLESRWLEMEITESVFLRGVEDSERIVRQLAGLGVAITIDDFGTGYSSLSYLKRFSVHGIKVDRSFVHDIVVDPQDVAIVRAIVAMAHSLGVKVIAEGVETETQLAMLRELGCDEYQGYLCSRPIAAAEFEKFVRSAG